MPFEYKPHRDSYDAPIDPNRCKAAVSFGGRAVGFRQCLRKPWKDGWCKQHHPDTVAERRKRQDRMAQQRLENSPIMRLVKARREIEGLQARIDKARDEAANGIEFTMHGGRGGYAKRLCRIIEILKGDDETDSAQ